MSLRIGSISSQYYHVYNRGVEKRVVFENQHDYQRFILLLLLCNDTISVDIANSIRDYSIQELIEMNRDRLVNICAFSILPNHYHLLLSPVVDGGISKFMQKVATGYTMYFNKKNNRTGALFQGKYKIKHVEDEFYLKYLFEYIHLNPVREEFDTTDSKLVEALLEKAENEPWTSLSVYSGREVGKLSASILSKKLFEELFDSYAQHRNLLKDWKIDIQNNKHSEEGRTFFTSSGRI